jgi:hypothetical protein
VGSQDNRSSGPRLELETPECVGGLEAAAVTHAHC